MTDFDLVHDRLGTGSAKWSKYPADVLPMWVADMDFPAAPEIIEAITHRLQHPILGYGVAKDELRTAIVEDLETKYQWTVAPEEIVFLPGVEPGFNMAMKAFLEPGDGITVQTPVYRPILSAPGHWGLMRRDAALTPGVFGWELELEPFKTELGKSKAFLLCNPQNPTGKVFSREELTSMADACREQDVLVISDEIHCELLFDGRHHIPVASLSDDAAQRTVTLMAASKTYNIAGLKTAFAIIKNRRMRETFSASRLGMVDSVNIIGLEATLAAYTQASEWKTAMLRYLESNRDFLSDEINRRFPSINVIKAEGTFLAWLDCTALKLESDPQTYFLENGKVGFSAGSEFGPDYANFIRLNFACPRALLVEGLDRIERALKATNSRA
ncbi:aminotransferase [Rhizobium sp. Leaf155]|nr:aminotransferase [Rhizobium sp. Leaf155]